ncbi:ribosomal protein S18 acetylase RimI-like enzyme [Defluviimonas denitrificans]|jgi:GNAT superfamily N-acetyltransferase|uniref:Ribosomal protein S18 acetylase RimI-like enzyme n=1 Tax=Albidovulum denitrificans TaxID=404881 RepID=A0A2S8SAH1_9RHOB|nr:GNAT family N-acetyltransferase [Defluviimonas denitrificans]PQV57708.1 ribosomal protein S18 acetylase RimI-like enzyme [Defluviimonas denitrificans]
MSNHPSVVIRPIEAGDEAEWRRLWRAYLAFYKTERPEQVYATTFARLLSGKENEFKGFIALVDGRPVGLTHYLFHRTCWAEADTCYLQDLYADPEMRGKGIGRALIEAVYAAADDHGAATVYWMTQDFNTTARQLYDRIATLTPFIKYQRP